MQLFYAPDFTPPVYTLSEEESLHALRVLRMGVGDTLNITDGRGNMYLCRITDVAKKNCSVEVITHTADFEAMGYRLTMAVAPTKNIERFEWFLEKATEIGTTEFIALECDHSERRVIKYDREMKVITAAVKQSLKAYHPSLRDMTSVDEVLRAPFAGRKFIAHCDTPLKGKTYLPRTLRKGEDALILIGPEGDFSKEEIALAVENGFEEISLGVQRFRDETAGAVAAAMVSVINNM